MQNEIIQFKDEITKEVIEQIQELPEEITSEKEFSEIYEAYQLVRKLRLAVDKKAVKLIGIEKANFESLKELISQEKFKILNILTPIETKLLSSRKEWEDKKAQIAKEKAEAIAKKQQAEFERQQKIKDEIEAWGLNEQFDQQRREDEAREAENQRLKVEAEKSAKQNEISRLEAELRKEMAKAQQNLRGVLAKVSNLTKPTKEDRDEMDRLGIKPGTKEEKFHLQAKGRGLRLGKKLYSTTEEEASKFRTEALSPEFFAKTFKEQEKNLGCEEGELQELIPDPIFKDGLARKSIEEDLQNKTEIHVTPQENSDEEKFNHIFSNYQILIDIIKASLKNGFEEQGSKDATEFMLKKLEEAWEEITTTYTF